MTREEILALVREKDIQIVRLWFTDILGFVKGFNLAVTELERALDEGVVFDGSSVEGFVRIEESDLVARPDLSAVYLWPEDVSGDRSLVFFCDIFYPDGRPFESDPRQVLRRALERAKEKGFTYYVGPELEYFYFPSPDTPEPLDAQGYFDILPFDAAARARWETLRHLENMGVHVEATHHEVAQSQHEIDFRYQDALRMADILQLTKLLVKAVAQKHGVYATFMPKPVFGINGSGLHVHQSLFKGGENAFFDADHPYNLSKIARGYLAGLLKYAPEITAITNQWVNSYKRLVVGYEAPVYIAWGRKNRSALVRVPAFKKGKSKSCRLEYRAPDPGTNPYLAFSAMLTAGLAGIEEGMEPPEPVEENIYAMPEEVMEKYGIGALPDSLLTAIRLMEQSEVARRALGDALFEKYLRNKKAEWDRFRTAVTDFEIREYLPRL